MPQVYFFIPLFLTLGWWLAQSLYIKRLRTAHSVMRLRTAQDRYPFIYTCLIASMLVIMVAVFVQR